MPKPRKPRLTKNQTEWNRQYKLLQRRIKSWEKRTGLSAEGIIDFEQPKTVRQKNIENIKSLQGNLLSEILFDNQPPTPEPLPEEIEPISISAAPEPPEYPEAPEAEPIEPIDYISPGAFDVFNIVRNYINSLPDVKYFKGRRTGDSVPGDLSDEKQKLLDMLDERIEIAEDSGTLGNYIDYLKQNWDSLQDAFERVVSESDESRVYSSFNRAFEIIKGGALTEEEAIRAEDYFDELISFTDYS